MAQTGTWLEFRTFSIRAEFSDTLLPQQTSFNIHPKSEGLSGLPDSSTFRLDGSSVIDHSWLDEDNPATTESVVARLGQIQNALIEKEEELNTHESRALKLAKRIESVEREVEKKKQPIDLTSVILVHFGEIIEEISWTSGAAAKDVISIATSLSDELDVENIFHNLESINGYLAEQWSGEDLNDCITQIAKVAHKQTTSKPPKDWVLVLEKASSEIQRLESDAERALQALRQEHRNLSEERASLEASISQLVRDQEGLVSLKKELSQSLDKRILKSFVGVGINPKPGVTLKKFLNELLDLVMAPPYNSGGLDVVTMVLQNPMASTVLRAMLSKQLNRVGPNIKTCCWNQRKFCRCDAAASSRVEVETRLNLSWKSWSQVIDSRHMFCWPFILESPRSLIKRLTNFYSTSLSFDYMLECMLAPDWTMSEAVLRRRLAPSSHLSDLDNQALNQLLRKNFGFSRSDALEALLSQHPVFSGKDAGVVMLWLGYLIDITSVDFAASYLAEYLDDKSAD